MRIGKYTPPCMSADLRDPMKVDSTSCPFCVLAVDPVDVVPVVEPVPVVAVLVPLVPVVAVPEDATFCCVSGMLVSRVSKNELMRIGCRAPCPAQCSVFGSLGS